MNSTSGSANNYLRGVSDKTPGGGGNHFLDTLPTSPKYFHNALPPAGIIGNSMMGTTSTLPYIKNKSANIILFTS